MPAYTFTKSAQSELYLYSETGSPVSGKPYTVGFLQDPQAASFPATLSLADSCADANGLYLFFQEAVADEAAFVADVRAFVAAGGLQAARFLWIANSAASSAFWEISELSVAGSGAAVLSRYAEIRLQNYTLCLDRGLAVSLSDPGAGAPHAAFVVTQPSSGALRLKTGSGDPPLEDLGATVEIPMEGAAIGCLRFQLTIARSATAGPGTQMGALQAGLSYFYPDPVWDQGFLSILSYPVLSPASAPLVFYPALDPLNPALASRTLFCLLAPDGSGVAALPSYYRTWVGRGVGLTPKTGESPGFALSPRPRFAGDPAPPYTLTPAGGFTLDIAPIANAVTPPGESDSATRLMCGLSPVEYVGYLPPGAGSVANEVIFHPGHPAYAGSFDPGEDSGAAQAGGGGLTAEATTSYLSFAPHGPAALNYYSQPDQSVFYDPSASAPPGDPDFLDMKEILVGPLAPGDAAALPMVPFAGLDGSGPQGAADQALHARFEIKVISQARRAAVQPAQTRSTKAAAASPITSRATTRHGMLGFFGTPTADGEPLVQVQLAQSEAGAQTLMLGGPAGGDITGPLRQALQSSQVFLVISNATLFQQNGALLSSVLAIAGIPFDLDPATWAGNGTILIYKYAGASIADLAADLGAWACPEEFTDGGLTQSDLLTLIKGIRAKVEPPIGAPDPDFLHIYEAVTDPAWNGVIAFNADVSLARMPSQLAGIAAGIDPARFRAHHLGINISPMTVRSGVLTMQDTALFGLINYVDDTPFSNTGAGDGFKVSALKILLGNSEIRDFACTIDLMVATLFGSAVRLADATPGSPGDGPPPPSVILLNGYYQRTASGDSFSFSSDRDLHFKAASQTLDEVEITGADFVTLNPDAPVDQHGVKAMRTRFVFSGRLRFHELPGFDALSFGDTTDASPILGGLAYANLVIHMDYDIDADGVAQNRVFGFDAQNLTVDIASSVARPQSLAAHFPLKFKGFLQGQSGSTPAGLGYLAASTPITETPLTYPWYALQYDLNLGTFGALAGSAGFTASVLIGWSAAPGPSLYTGVKIPGASPENLTFSIEGLLGLSIDDIRFTADASPDGAMAYTLVFTNLALRVFGMKLPQSAYVDLVLFGNPDPSKQAASLGWYAAYTAA